MSYTPQYTKPYANGYVDRPSKETPERASFINARDDTLIRIEKYLSTLNFDGKYALLTEAGYSLELSIDEYYVLTISLKNKAGTVISGKQIDLPIESMIVNVDYDEESGILTFSLQNGQTLDVNISTLVRGLVPTSRKIAGVDLEDDITAEELKEALGIYEGTVSVSTDLQWGIAGLSADVATSTPIGYVIPFDSCIDSSNISFDSENHGFILKAGHTYELESIVRFISSAGYKYFRFYDNVNKVTLGISGGCEVATSSMYNDAITPAKLIVTPEVDTLYTLIVDTASNTTGTATFIQTSYFKVVELLENIYERTEVIEDIRTQIASVSDEVDAVEEKLSDKVLPQYKNYGFPATGWYRVAKLSSIYSYFVDLQIIRTYANTPSETHKVSISNTYGTDGINFCNEASFSKGIMVPKVRVTKDTANNQYIEIYYEHLTAGNNIVISLANTIDTSLIQWTLIDAVATAETVDGITVFTTHEFSRNKSYESEIEATNEKLTTYPYFAVKLMTEEAIDNYYDTVGENLGTTDTHYTRVVQHGVSHSVLKGGNYFLEGYRANSNFEWQKITLYSVDRETRKFERSKVDAVWTEWVSTSYRADIDAINSRLAYKDISSSIDVGDSGCTAHGYVENGQVIIRITYPAGAKGDKRLNVDIAYGPRMTVYGSANGNASDFGKLTTSWISPECIIFVHASEEPEVEMTAIFTYPLKTS